MRKLYLKIKWHLFSGHSAQILNPRHQQALNTLAQKLSQYITPVKPHSNYMAK